MKHRYQKYERYLMPASLVLGFVVDVVTFRLINFSVALFLLFCHIALAGLCIFFIDIYESGKLQNGVFRLLRIFTPLVIQYSFGTLFSASLIFYSTSGALTSSWPFILILVFLMLANEIFKKHYINPVFQISVYFFAVFSFAILGIPYISHSLGNWIFILSGLLSLGFIALFLRFLLRHAPSVLAQKNKIIFGIVLVFVLMNFFYFTNMIPPFPLSIRDIGVYHSVEKTSEGNYYVISEKPSFLEFFLPYEKYHISFSGESAYVFSSVFSPARFNLNIVHEWQMLDVGDREWKTLNTVSFGVVGGRSGGYRGYSIKTDIVPGKWRVNVKTSSGQIIGRFYFKVLQTNEKPVLISEVR